MPEYPYKGSFAPALNPRLLIKYLFKENPLIVLSAIFSFIALWVFSA
jgi:hypothetical protein